MKRILLIAASIAIVAWMLTSTCASVVPWLWAEDAVEDAANRPWPGGLGPLSAVAPRYPPLEANEASRRFATLAAPVQSDEKLDEYLRAEITRDERSIGAPPTLPDVTALRDLLLRESIAWARSDGLGDEETNALRGAVMRVARVLIASALAKARTGDPAAWDDLLAVWNLARALDPYPQMMLQTAALSMVRWINAVAWKMPLPAPPWFGEFLQRDAVLRLLEAFQHQAATYWNGRESMFPTKGLARSIDRDRGIAEALFGETGGFVDAPMNDLGTDLSAVWRRAFRFRAEREATANAIRVLENRPIESSSRCSDGGWTFDGATLRFAREIPTAPPDMPMPLTLRVVP